MALPPPKRGEMGAFYRVFGPMELSAALRYTTREPVHATLCECTQPDGIQTRGYIKMIYKEPAAVAGGEAERSLTAAVTLCAEHVQQPRVP